MAPLGLLSRGERAEIAEINGLMDCGHGTVKKQLCHAGDIGLRIGKMVEMLNNEGHGPVLLKVDGARIAIGRGMAMKIIVKKSEQCKCKHE